jgi:hypothetical protein
MAQLDPKTLELLAKVIVDMDGPFERTGRELERLLVRAGWPDPPDYDGSFRIGWLLDAIRERGSVESDVERLICRVCDPLEYDDGMDSAEAFRSEVNRILGRERLAVSFVSGRPVIGGLAEDGTTTVYSAPADLEERIERLIQNRETAEFLINRARETKICETSGAYTLAIIGIGSLIEGLLMAILIQRDALNDKNGNALDPTKVSLFTLIERAHSQDLIQVDAKDFLDPVREYRNFVHLRAQMARRAAPDRDSVMLCWGPVRAILNDLEERILERA